MSVPQVCLLEHIFLLHFLENKITMDMQNINILTQYDVHCD